MTSAVTRELSLTWNGITIGGTSEYEPHDAYSQRITYDAFDITLQVLVRADTAALFTAACVAFETAIRVRDAALAITLSGQSLRSFDPAAGTAFETFGDIVKRGNLETDSGRARVYTVTFRGRIPPPAGDNPKDERISISYDAERRAEITYNLTWSREGATSASSAYNSAKATYYASNNGAYLSGYTLKKVLERIEPDRTDSEARITCTWRQLIDTATASALDHANIEDHTLQIQIDEPAPGDSSDRVVRLRTITCTFQGSINSEETTDLDTLWDGTILPHIESQVQALFSPRHLAQLNANPQYQPTSNRITASIVYEAAIGSTDLIASEVEVAFDEQSGIDFTPAWDGNPLSAYADEANSTRLRMTTSTKRVLGIVGPTSRLKPGGSTFGAVGSVSTSGSAGRGNFGLRPEPGGSAANPNGWNLVSSRSGAKSIYKGTADVGFWETTITDTIVERYVERPRRGGRRGRGGINPGGGTPVSGIGGPRT